MKCLMKSAVQSEVDHTLTPVTGRAWRNARGLLLVASVMPLLAGAAPAAKGAPAGRVSDFPTTARVEYVLECMKNHEGKYEFMYKCSCAVDQIGVQVKYDDFVEISTALRHQTLGGERGAEFRDPQVVRQMAARYKKIEEDSADACFIK